MNASSPLNLTVLGAGLAGLTAAHEAKKRGWTVAVLEKSNRAGGVVQTENVNTFQFERGPNTVTLTPDIEDLIKELNLTDEVLLADAKIPRYIQYKGKLHPVPMSPKDFLLSSLLSPLAKTRLLAEPLISKRKDHRDESLYDFAHRRLGKEITQKLLMPFISGVWAGRTDQLSAQSTFPQLALMEKEYGSLIKGAFKKKKASRNGHAPIRKGFISFKKGLRTLTEALAQSLEGSISFDETIESLSYNDSTWVITTNKKEWRSKRLVVSIPAFQSAPLFQDIMPSVGNALQAIPYVPLVVLHMSWPKDQIGHTLNGFGYLTCPDERQDILACLWSSSLFPGRAPADHALFTVFIGGAQRPDLIERPDEDLWHLSKKTITPLLDLKGDGRLLRLIRHTNALPQYTIGHIHREEVLQKAEQEIPTLRFTGNYRDGISVGDVIKNAKKAVLSF